MVPRSQPEVLLLDVNMPGMSGVEVVRELRSLPEASQPRILMLTISKSEEDLMGAYKGCAPTAIY
jgi:CheY-like chemotaxis protein